jgi:hypothetical protein
VLRHAKEKIVSELLAVVELGEAALGVDGGDAAVRHEGDAALGEGGDERL